MTEISGTINQFPGTFNPSWGHWYISLLYQRSISWGLIRITASVLYFLLIMTIHDYDYDRGINHNDYDDDNDDYDDKNDDNDDQW